MKNNNITFVLSEKIKKAAKEYSLFDGVKKILVALSGGADSCTLLIALSKLSESPGFEISAVHINHMIRGSEADRDEEFAKALCERYGVEFFPYRIDVPRLAKQTGQSTELCARNERYRIFSELSQTRHFDAVATAHTASDNAETVLFNLARGSGIKGLCGIPPKRSLVEGVSMIRPLIYVTRIEVEEYLSFLGESYVTDSTNLSDDYTRNFIRHEIIPRFCKINPSFEDTVSRSSRLLLDDSICLEEEAEEVLCDDVKTLAGLSESIRSRVIIRLFGTVSSETLSLANVKDISNMIVGGRTGRVSISCPDRISAVCENGRFHFEKEQKSASKPYEMPIAMGESFCPDGGYAVFASCENCSPDVLNCEEIIYKKYNTVYLYSDKIIDNLSVRNRRNGDVLKKCGMTKSVKRLLCEKKVPLAERNVLPFVCKDGQIVCIPFVGASDEFERKKGRENVLTLTFYKNSTL